MNEKTIAGPAFVAAAIPVKVKIPAPMMAGVLRHVERRAASRNVQRRASQIPHAVAMQSDAYGFCCFILSICADRTGGRRQRTSGGEVRIAICREGGMLVIRVTDNGPGLNVTADAAFDRGIGLRNTRERLERLYAGRYRFELSNRDEGGLTATVALPFHDIPVHATLMTEAFLV